MGQVPDKPSIEGLDEKWRAHWEQAGTYRFDRTKSRAEIYSIDTPPPTVSGALHIGHCCSYTHKDLIARSSTRWVGTTTASTSSAASS
jgi:valyl-tRNA synthetase